MSLFSRCAQKRYRPMAGRPIWKTRSEYTERLGISRGHISIVFSLVYVLAGARVHAHCFCSAQTQCHVRRSAPMSDAAIFESLHSTLALPCQHALLPFTLRSRIQHSLPLSHSIPRCDSRFPVLQVYFPAAFVVCHGALVMTRSSSRVRTR